MDRLAPIVLALVFLSFPSPAFTQAKSETPKFTSKTELVLVPTIVTDKKGNPVHGLTKEDFEVVDNKKPQTISVFEEITTSQRRAQAASTVSPTEFTNRVTPDGPSGPRRLTIIAFDLINTPTLRQAIARKQLLEFLSEMANSGEPTAVYAITQKGMKVITDFTTDPQLLASVLQKMKFDHGMSRTELSSKAHSTPFDSPADTGGGLPGGSMNLAAANASGGNKALTMQTSLENFLEEIELNLTSAETRWAVQYTLDGMAQIAQACSAVPGRKALIWVTGGFPFDISPTDMMYNPDPRRGMAPAGRAGLDDVLGLYMRTWRTLNDAQISVYPIDVQGVVNPAAADASFRNRDPRLEPRARRYSYQQTVDTESTFAQATGGKAYYNSGDLKKGFAQAFQDSSSYYEIGYYLKPEQTTKIQWREITVKSSRHGLDIRARRGYFYNPTVTDLQATRDHDLSAGIFSPVDFTTIPMTLRWKPVEAGEASATRHVQFELELPPNFAHVDEADNNRILFDIAAQTRTPEGTPVGSIFNRALDDHLDGSQFEQIRERGLTYTDTLDLPPGQYIVRFVVRDGLDGRMGSLAARLKVQ